VADLRAALASAPADAPVAIDVIGPTGAARTVNVALAMAPELVADNDPNVVYNRALLDLETAARTGATPAARTAAELNLAIVRMRLGGWSDAHAALAGIQLPDGAGLSSGTVAYLTGLCLEALGRGVEAQAAFAKAAAAPEARLGSDGALVAPLARLKLASAR
jgi:hypothetical protein